MKTHNSYKCKYTIPKIAQIKLDNEISLVLESTPPTYETSNKSIAPDYFNNDPFKTNIS